MYNPCKIYPYVCWLSIPSYNHIMYNICRAYPYTCHVNRQSIDRMKYYSRSDSSESTENNDSIEIEDYGPKPFVVNIKEATKQNNTYRTALWTGQHLQLTLMSIDVGDDIGLEIHPHVDQFIRIEEGQGLVKMGNRKDNLDFQKKVYDNFAFVIPAGKWHDLINTGNKPIKLYSIYAPPQHPHGTVHKTKADAETLH
ncbi:cupin domain-containing protein [Clostridium sp. LBM24168]